MRISDTVSEKRILKEKAFMVDSPGVILELEGIEHSFFFTILLFVVILDFLVVFFWVGKHRRDDAVEGKSNEKSD